MKNLLERLPAFDSKHKCYNVIIETPKGSRFKYAYDFESGLLELKRALPKGLMFPFNFGFIPGTRGDDGDPLDILILNEEPLVAGCLLKAHIIGVLKARQTEKRETTRNDRLIGLAIGKQTPDELKAIRLENEILSQIEFFFVSYNRLCGKKFKVLGTGGPQKARAIIRRGIESTRKKNKT